MQKQKKRRNEDGFEQWGGYMNAKISKLENQFDKEKRLLNQNGDNGDLFKGISIFVNGHTDPSADELRCLMLVHGGTYHHYYRSGKTTHIVASVLPNTKFNQMDTLKVVVPEWITESIKAGKLLNYNNYLLQNYFPGAMQKKMNIPLINYAVKKEVGRDLKVGKTAADEGYLTEFYNNSRLHYISTLASELKQLVWMKREGHNGVFPKRMKLMNTLPMDSLSDCNFTDNNVIMHIDMDCFFVSVALRKYPHYKGHPVAVTHARGGSGSKHENVNKKFEVEFYKEKILSKIKPKQKELSNNEKSNKSDCDKNDDETIEKWSREANSMSEIASCSYEARQAGVRKGMYLGAALNLCPNLKTVPYDFEGYKEVSMTLYNTVAEYTLDIEAVSCDELFIDCTNLLDETKITPLKFAEILREEISEKTGCTSSIGIGKNKLQSRLATKHAKPNGQFHLTSDKIDDFMKELNVHDLPGVGRTIGAQLENLSVKNCRDLQNLSLATLQKEFGKKTGESLYKHCRGEDDKTVNYAYERKSVSAEVNYGIRFNDDEETEIFLEQLSQEVSKRLNQIKMTGKNITLKIMFRAKEAPIEAAKYLGHGACDSLSRSANLSIATNDASVIAKHVKNLYHQSGVPANELRGIGIQMTKLENNMKSVKTLHRYFDQNREEKVEEKKKVVPEVSKSMRSLKANEEDFENQSEKETSNAKLSTSQVNVKSEDLTNEMAGGHHQSSWYTEEANSFSELHIDELKTLLRDWVTTEQSPKPLDVDLLKTYFCNLVARKNIEKLCILTRCLHRHIKTDRGNSSAWHKAYNHVVDGVQGSMTKVFGRPLSNEAV